MPVTAVLRALEAGDNTGAEAALKPLLGAEPENPHFLRLLAITLSRQDRMADAEAVLRRCVAAEPSADALGFLADVQYRLHAFADCEATLERVVDLGAATAAQYRLLAKLKSVAGNVREAQALLRKALDRAPDDIELMVAYGDSFSATPDEACAVYEALLPRVAGQLHLTSYLLKRLTLQRARANRISAGLLPDTSSSWQDTCVWPDPEGLARLHQALVAEVGAGSSARAGAYVDLGCVALLHQNWAMAEALFAHVRNAMREPVTDCAAFGAAFHEPLEKWSDADIFAGLAPVQQVLMLRPQAPVTLFLASDYGYFTRFSLQFVKSLEAAGVRADVQIHLLDGKPAQWSDAAAALSFAKTVRVGLSAEASGVMEQGLAQARLYYHAVRFIRLYEEVKRTGRATWLLDADVYYGRDPASVFEQFKGFDVALCGVPSSFEPTLKIAGGCVGIAPTAPGLEYARRVAAYIAYWKANDRWTWGVDQLGLYSCYARMYELNRLPATQFLDRDVCARVGERDSVFQFPAGIEKYAPRDKKG